MKKITFLTVALFISMSAFLFGCSKESSGDASDFPTKPIEVIVPWDAGGSTDATIRALAEGAKDVFGQPLVIVNRSGANGTVATSELATNKKKHDGYTVIAEAGGVMTAQPSLKDLPYSHEDFKGIIGLSYDPILLAVNADSKYETLDDLLAEKDSGNVLKYSHSGSGSFPHLAQSKFFEMAGIQAEDVPYKGGNPALMALLGGHVDVHAGHPFDLLPQAEAGKIRILGIFSPERFEELPDIPTLKEQGFDIDMSVWKFLMVPKDTPEEVVKVLEEKFKEIVNGEKFQTFAKNNGLYLVDLDGDAVDEKLDKERAEHKKLLEDMGLAIN